MSVFWNIRQSFIKGNIRNFLGGFRFLKYKYSFLLRKCKKFLILELEISIFLPYKNFSRGGLFFFELGLKSALSSSMLYYSRNAQIERNSNNFPEDVILKYLTVFFKVLLENTTTLDFLSFSHSSVKINWCEILVP